MHFCKLKIRGPIIICSRCDSFAAFGILIADFNRGTSDNFDNASLRVIVKINHRNYSSLARFRGSGLFPFGYLTREISRERAGPTTERQSRNSINNTEDVRKRNERKFGGKQFIKSVAIL